VTERLSELRAWLAGVLPDGSPDLVPASSDASFRRYFRLRAGGVSRIAMDAPPDRESVQRYVDVARILAGAGVHVPEILALDVGRGFLLLEDLGDATYLDALRRGADAEALYADALAALVRIQSRADAGALPRYDRALLERELGIFREWFLGRHLGVDPEETMPGELARIEAFLVAEALAQPVCFVHRDYHSRNLMPSHPNPGVLDFQDAVAGPVSYDVVSLLRDCYIAWPPARVEAWLHDYHAAAAKAGVPLPQLAAFTRGFDLAGIQRHLKAIGIFARLWHRDGKPGYLDDIPRVLDYVLGVAAGYRELDPLRRLIEEEVLPRSRT
jgi:aminoglycoside/choline kinase family phosphotransferase